MSIPSNIIPFVLPAAPVAVALPAKPTYTEGAFVYASWGYDQTNIEFYRITKRKGDWLTLTPLVSLNEDNPTTMTGTCTPGFTDTTKKPIRRQIRRRDGEEIGCIFKPTYGWIQAWEGKPVGYTCYA